MRFCAGLLVETGIRRLMHLVKLRSRSARFTKPSSVLRCFMQRGHFAAACNTGGKEGDFEMTHDRLVKLLRSRVIGDGDSICASTWKSSLLLCTLHTNTCIINTATWL